MIERILLLSLLFWSLLCSAENGLNLGLPRTYGYASYYGREFQGKKMANGQKFDCNKYTAASYVYPLGTLLTVYYSRTHLSVVVFVTDRGPGVEHRVLDLSERAATVLGLKPYGVDWVEITPWRFYGSS